MKKVLFFLIASCHCVCAQQKIVIKDSVLLSVLDRFVDELKLEEKKYKLIRVQLISYNRQSKATSSDTITIGKHKAVEVQLPIAYDVHYSLELHYEINSKTIDWNPVTYYSIHRNIPVLMTTGFENLIETVRRNKKELTQVIEKTSSPHAMAPVIIWIVDVSNKKVTIRKPTEQK